MSAYRYFKYQGVEGAIDENDYVTWGGVGFHKSAVTSWALMTAIDRAKPRADNEN